MDISGYGNNRKACKRASGGVGLLVRDGLQARTLKDETEGVLWVEVKLEDEGKVAVGVVYANPEGVRSEETEVQFEKVGADLLEWRRLGYKVVLMGDFNAHIGRGATKEGIHCLKQICTEWPTVVKELIKLLILASSNFFLAYFLLTVPCLHQ